MDRLSAAVEGLGVSVEAGAEVEPPQETIKPVPRVAASNIRQDLRIGHL
jgi:hypothetical protein